MTNEQEKSDLFIVAMKLSPIDAVRFEYGLNPSRGLGRSSEGAFQFTIGAAF